MDEAHFIYLSKRTQRMAKANSVFLLFISSLICLSIGGIVGLYSFVGLNIVLFFYALPDVEKEILIERRIWQIIQENKPIKTIKW
jgi:hypothetical protein